MKNLYLSDICIYSNCNCQESRSSGMGNILERNIQAQFSSYRNVRACLSYINIYILSFGQFHSRVPISPLETVSLFTQELKLLYRWIKCNTSHGYSFALKSELLLVSWAFNTSILTETVAYSVICSLACV